MFLVRGAEATLVPKRGVASCLGVRRALSVLGRSCRFLSWGKSLQIEYLVTALRGESQGTYICFIAICWGKISWFVGCPYALALLDCLGKIWG